MNIPTKFVQIGPAVWEEKMFEEIVDDARRTTDTSPLQKLPLSTLCLGELKKKKKNKLDCLWLIMNKTNMVFHKTCGLVKEISVHV